MSEIEISLFPIPGSVSFPFTVVPLHVFEPRYRLLIKDAIRDGRRVGVCHTKREISPARPHPTKEENLRSNQATYEPCGVFGAGVAEILDITEDGRILTEISIDARYEIVSEVQTLPYRIVKCRRYEDDAEQAHPDASILRQALTARLTQMGEELGEEFSMTFQRGIWAELSDEEFSFKIFQIIRFEPDTLQHILEYRTARERLKVVLDALGAA